MNAKPVIASPDEGYPSQAAYRELATSTSYKTLDEFSRQFLKSNESLLGDYAREWVTDPLNTWSRRWEYCYVLERIQNVVSKRRLGRAKILDAGSGLTFFPHYIGQQQFAARVDCYDIDSKIAATGNRLFERSSLVSYMTADMAGLGCPNNSFDIAYCISVLEHCDEYRTIIEEFARVITANGVLILTVDVSLDGKADIQPARLREMIQQLSICFTPIVPYADLVDVVNESMILTTTSSYKASGYALLPWQKPRLSQMVRHILRHRQFPKQPPLNLTCFCMTWIRKGDS